MVLGQIAEYWSILWVGWTLKAIRVPIFEPMPRERASNNYETIARAIEYYLHELAKCVFSLSTGAHNIFLGSINTPVCARVAPNLFTLHNQYNNKNSTIVFHYWLHISIISEIQSCVFVVG